MGKKDSEVGKPSLLIVANNKQWPLKEAAINLV
jgi:hypothetical protein